MTISQKVFNAYMYFLYYLKDIFNTFHMSTVCILSDNYLGSNCYFFDANHENLNFSSHVWTIIAPNLFITKTWGRSHLIGFDLLFSVNTILDLQVKKIGSYKYFSNSNLETTPFSLKKTGYISMKKSSYRIKLFFIL